MRRNLPDLPNSKLTFLIDEWIHSEIERDLLKRYLIDGVSIEPLSEEICKSPRQTARIIKRATTEIFSHVS